MNHPIILYHYSFSPYARRIIWYLRLRGIPYLSCPQPPTLPRPSVALLGLKYRRIPILSIGRDVYLDTRLIIPKLDRLLCAPEYADLSPPLGTVAAGIARLLSAWTTDAGLFGRAMQLLPGADLPLLKDWGFQRDRADYVGRSTSAEEAAALRPEAMAEIRDGFELLETTFLADGRDWILGGQDPTTVDIEGVWVVHWVAGLKGALDTDTISRKKYPKVFGWIERFQQRVGAAKSEIKNVSGEEARDIICGAESVEEGADGSAYESQVVDANELVVRFYGLQKGQMIEVWPIDSGSAHVDIGRLLGLTKHEVVFETDRGVRVHAPRHGFRVRPAVAPSAPNL